MVTIYKITNLINGKIYIGSTNNINSRFSDHKSKLNKGIHFNDHLQSAWNKYGYDSFEFKALMVCSDSERNDCEQMLMDLYDAQNHDFGYNIRDADAHSVSKKTKQKISETRINKGLSKGENNLNYGNPSNWSPSQEHKSKISDANSGKNNPNAKYTLWDITKCYYNKGNMFQNGNDGKSPRRCFQTKYNGYKLPIVYNLDFYTPELINDLINEALGVD